MIQQRVLLREVIWHVYECMGGVMQTAVLLQSRHHHENVYVVLADGKRSTSYIISIYDGIKLAPIKRSLHAKGHQHIKVFSSRRLQPNNPEPSGQERDNGKSTAY